MDLNTFFVSGADIGIEDDKCGKKLELVSDTVVLIAQKEKRC
jgi:hypothetical protein